MALPVVAIVGRPNVGKSSLFNMLIRRRASIVEPTPGVTRDRVSSVWDVNDTFFELVDTGGFGMLDKDDLGAHVERQIRYAVEAASLILFVVDAREGLMPLDRATADLLRRHTEIVRLVANKVDEPHLGDEVSEFTRLGFGEPLTCSATNRHGRRELIELISESIKSSPEDKPADPTMRIAIVGKRNAGKSSFINALAQEERVIVSETPGTTRDSVDVRFEKDGRTIIAIDTAGVRKKNKMENDIEFYAYMRVTESIRRADVVLFLIDATEPVSQIDKRLGKLIATDHTPCLFVVNKWDLARGIASTDDYGEYLTKLMPGIDYAPISFTSAITGKNVNSSIDLATELFKQAQTRVGTGKLNQVLGRALEQSSPRAKRGSKPPKFLYASQVSTNPPTIVIFVNAVKLVTAEYQRFLVNRFREHLPFSEIPIRLIFRGRRQNSGPSLLDSPTLE